MLFGLPNDCQSWRTLLSLLFVIFTVYRLQKLRSTETKVIANHRVILKAVSAASSATAHVPIV